MEIINYTGTYVLENVTFQVKFLFKSIRKIKITYKIKEDKLIFL